MTFATETVKIWTINTTTSCHNKPHYLVVVRDNIWFSDTAFRIIFYLSTTVCLACFPLSLCPFFWLLRKIKESHSPILPPNGGEKYSLISLLFFGNNANIFVFVTEYLLFVFPSLAVVGPLMLSILARGLLSDCTYRGGRRTGWKHLWGNINISCEERTLNPPTLSPVWLQNILPDPNCVPRPDYLLDLLLVVMKNCPWGFERKSSFPHY